MSNDIKIFKFGPHQQDTVMLPDGICRCICVGQHCNTNNYLKILVDNRIRKMTTREIGRLMDVDDDDITKMINSGVSPGNINSLYGNSIVVNVLCEIFRNMLNPVSKNKISLF